MIRRATRPVAAFAVVLLATVAVSACGDEPDEGPVVGDPGPIHALHDGTIKRSTVAF